MSGNRIALARVWGWLETPGPRERPLLLGVDYTALARRSRTSAGSPQGRSAVSTRPWPKSRVLFGMRVDSELDVLEGKISVQVVVRTNGRPRNPIAFLGDSLLSCVAPWRFRAKVRTSRLTHPKNTKATMKSHSRTKGPIFSMRLRGPHAAGRVLESIKKITGELEDLQAEIYSRMGGPGEMLESFSSREREAAQRSLSD